MIKQHEDAHSFIAQCESHEHEADVSIPIIAQKLAVIRGESHSP